MCVCGCVYVCVHSNLLPHTLESQKRDTNGFIAIQESFSILPISFKCFIQKLRRNMLAYLEQLQHPSAFSPPQKPFYMYVSFEAYSYVFTAQTTGLWKTACDSLAQMRIYSISHKKVKVPYRTRTVPLANLGSTTNRAVRFSSVRIINNAHQARRCWRSPAILVPT